MTEKTNSQLDGLPPLHNSQVRQAELSEIDQLARLWFDGWQDAHAAIVPAELVRLRTLESFRDRLFEMTPWMRVIGPLGRPTGFCVVQKDELDQLFVAAEARGSGTAAALIADGEHRMADVGVTTAWLACAIGNERAARFYEKMGWHLAGPMKTRLRSCEGTFSFESWRYEKLLRS